MCLITETGCYCEQVERLVANADYSGVLRDKIILVRVTLDISAGDLEQDIVVISIKNLRWDRKILVKKRLLAILSARYSVLVL